MTDTFMKHQKTKNEFVTFIFTRIDLWTIIQSSIKKWAITSKLSLLLSSVFTQKEQQFLTVYEEVEMFTTTSLKFGVSKL